jgi:hypothetical protein
VLIEGNQQVTKRGESFSPSLFTFRSHFATIHRKYYYDFMTAENWLGLKVAYAERVDQTGDDRVSEPFLGHAVTDVGNMVSELSC